MKTLSGRKGNRPLPLPGVLKFRTNILRIRRICESGSLRTPNIYAHIFNLVVLAADWEPVESWLGRVRAPADCNWHLQPIQPSQDIYSCTYFDILIWCFLPHKRPSQKIEGSIVLEWCLNKFQWQVWVTFKLSHTRSHQNEKKCHIFCRPAKRKITLARGKRTWKNCLNNVKILVLAWVWPAKRKRTLACGKRTWKNWLAVDLDLKLLSTMMVCWHVTRLSDSFGLSADSRTSDPLGETFTIWFKFANISRTFLRLWPFCDSWLL